MKSCLDGDRSELRLQRSLSVKLGSLDVCLALGVFSPQQQAVSWDLLVIDHL